MLGIVDRRIEEDAAVLKMIGPDQTIHHSPDEGTTEFDMITAASTAAQDLAVQVTRYPTKLHVACMVCGRQAYPEIFLEQVPKLICSGCGSKLVRVVTRDRMAAWSRRRQGR